VYLSGETIKLVLNNTAGTIAVENRIGVAAMFAALVSSNATVRFLSLAGLMARGPTTALPVLMEHSVLADRVPAVILNISCKLLVKMLLPLLVLRKKAVARKLPQSRELVPTTFETVIVAVEVLRAVGVAKSV
jgi:hypothetical protein